MARLALCAALFATTSGTRSLRAQEPDADAATRMAARDLAQSGADAFDKQDYATALDRFQRAETLYKVPSISVMVARSLAKVGRVVEAVDKYEETRRTPLEADAPEAFQHAVADASAEIEAVRARVAHVELRVPVTPPPGLEVTLDDKPVPPALLGVAQPVDPGTHHLAAHAPGRLPFSYDVTLADGGHQAVEISLPRLDEPKPAPARPLPPPPAPHRGPSTLSLALLGGGGLAIAAGAVTGVLALGHKSKLDDACSPGCPPNMGSDLDAFRRDRTLSYLGFGLGLAAAGTGTYLLLHQGSSGSQVGALVLPGGALVTGSF